MVDKIWCKFVAIAISKSNLLLKTVITTVPKSTQPLETASGSPNGKVQIKWKSKWQVSVSFWKYKW